MQLLQANHITKKFITTKALNDLSLTLQTGKIYGLLGPNGSGKTTLMKMMAGLIHPTKGELMVLGKHVGKETKKLVSYMPSNNHLPKWMKIKECIQFYKNVFEDFDEKKVHEMIKFMGFDENQKIKSLSTGMLQRVKLSLTLSRNASLYILDEPFSGIDPISREKIMEGIIKGCDEEKSIILSSHLVMEMENILEEVIFIQKGEIALSGATDKFREEKNMSIDELYKEVFKDA